MEHGKYRATRGRAMHVYVRGKSRLEPKVPGLLRHKNFIRMQRGKMKRPPAPYDSIVTKYFNTVVLCGATEVPSQR